MRWVVSDDELWIDIASLGNEINIVSWSRPVFFPFEFYTRNICPYRTAINAFFFKTPQHYSRSVQLNWLQNAKVLSEVSIEWKKNWQFLVFVTSKREVFSFLFLHFLCKSGVWMYVSSLVSKNIWMKCTCEFGWSRSSSIIFVYQLDSSSYIAVFIVHVGVVIHGIVRYEWCNNWHAYTIPFLNWW